MAGALLGAVRAAGVDVGLVELEPADGLLDGRDGRAQHADGRTQVKADLRAHVGIERVGRGHLDGARGRVDAGGQRGQPPAQRSGQARPDGRRACHLAQPQPAHALQLLLEAALGDGAAVDEHPRERHASGHGEKQRRLHLLGRAQARGDEASAQVDRHGRTLTEPIELPAGAA